MPAETLKNDPTKETPTVGDVTTRATSLAYDLITLAELQSRLLYIDLKECGTRSAGGGVILLGMLALVLSSVPVLLLGGADLLASGADLSPGVAKLIVGGTATFLGLIAGWISFKRLRKIVTVLGRSQQELRDNLEFVKSLVSGQNGNSNGHSSRYSFYR